MMKRNVIIAVCLVMCVAAAAFAVPQKTLANLQTAYNGESNANARYTAFALKADEDGYPQVAALFRAAAKAEEIHAKNHAVAIKELGAAPVKNIVKTEVKSTRENLKTAIAGEVYERDVMYPNFLKEARAENVPIALRTFNYALHAEAGHANLYTAAEKNLQTMTKSGVTYSVCSVCGYTVAMIDFNRCPNCGTPKDKFIAVS